MNTKLKFIALSFFYFLNLFAYDCMINSPALNGEKSIVVVIPSYNNKNWYKKNLASIFSQKYQNYRIIYIDDCSSDGTGDLVRQYVKDSAQEHRVTLFNNKERVTALPNLYHAIHLCNSRDIIVIVDGDDCLLNSSVLRYINYIYSDPNVWLTYGQFVEYPAKVKGFCRSFPSEIVEKNAFRSFQEMPSHLRTFYAGLFKKIKLEDLMYEGDFFKMTYDMAIMLPMIEMARDGHFKFIDEILYVYNSENQISDHKVNRELQRKLDSVIRSRKPYEKVTSPF